MDTVTSPCGERRTDPSCVRRAVLGARACDFAGLERPGRTQLDGPLPDPHHRRPRWAAPDRRRLLPAGTDVLLRARPAPGHSSTSARTCRSPKSTATKVSTKSCGPDRKPARSSPSRSGSRVPSPSDVPTPNAPAEACTRPDAPRPQTRRRSCSPTWNIHAGTTSPNVASGAASRHNAHRDGPRPHHCAPERSRPAPNAPNGRSGEITSTACGTA